MQRNCRSLGLSAVVVEELLFIRNQGSAVLEVSSEKTPAMMHVPVYLCC